MVLLYAGLFVARSDGRGLKRSGRLAARVPRCSRHHWRLRIETAASLTSREKARHSGKVRGRKNPKKVDARPTLSLHLRDESPMNPYESRCGKASTGFRNRSEKGRGTHG